MRVEQNYEVLDPDSALASVGGDVDFLCEIAGLVRAAWPTLMGNIREKLATGDLGTVEADARLAKAAAEYVSAKRAQESALLLEKAAGQGDLQGAQRAIAQLDKEVVKLQAVLATFRHSKAFDQC